MEENNKKIAMPQPESDGFFIRTLNNKGFMGAYPSDPYMKAFIEFSPSAPGPVLDIGAAYGVASLAALKAGAHVIANDIDERHLEILLDQAPDSLKNNLKLLPGAFPDGVSFEKETLGAVLAARVFHFFDGPTLQKSIEQIYRWLQPSGKLFVTVESPYLRNIQSFIPIYEQRLIESQEWPGFIDDFAKYDSRKGMNLPKTMHLLDPKTLCRVVEKAGFKVERCNFFARPEFAENMRLDGRESVGLVAFKG